MKRERLTPERIRKFSCPVDARQAFLWDTEVPRLALRVTAGGSKAFVFESKLDRQTVRMTIGDPRAWNVEDARAEARRLQTLVDQGKDPRQEKIDRIAAAEAKKAADALAEVTVGEAWTKYCENRSHTWGHRHRRDHERAMSPGGETIIRGKCISKDGKTAPGMLFPLASVRLADMNKKAVIRWLEAANTRGSTEASKHFRLLRAFVRWCAESDDFTMLVRADVCDGRSVRDHVKATAAHDDCLQREQLGLWFQHVRELANPVTSAYLQTLLLTGARREELAGLRWTDADFQWKGLTIRDKVEGERTIPMTPYVASLLAALPRRNEWVFSSPTAASGRLQEPRIPHNKALSAAGLPALTLHGLRRSFGTLAEWVECPAGVSAQIMGHKPSALAEKHYRRRPLDLLRQWHTKIEGWILEQAAIEIPEESEGVRHLRVAN